MRPEAAPCTELRPRTDPPGPLAPLLCVICPAAGPVRWSNGVTAGRSTLSRFAPHQALATRGLGADRDRPEPGQGLRDARWAETAAPRASGSLTIHLPSTSAIWGQRAEAAPGSGRRHEPLEGADPPERESTFSNGTPQPAQSFSIRRSRSPSRSPLPSPPWCEQALPPASGPSRPTLAGLRRRRARPRRSRAARRAHTRSCAPSFRSATVFARGRTESPSGAPQLPQRAVAIPRAASVLTSGFRERVKIHRWGRVASVPGAVPEGTTPIRALQRTSTCASVAVGPGSMARTATLPTAAWRNTRARWRPRSAVMSADISERTSAVASFAIRAGPQDWASIQPQNSSAPGPSTSSEAGSSPGRLEPGHLGRLTPHLDPLGDLRQHPVVRPAVDDRPAVAAVPRCTTVEGGTTVRALAGGQGAVLARLRSGAPDERPDLGERLQRRLSRTRKALLRRQPEGHVHVARLGPDPHVQRVEGRRPLETHRLQIQHRHVLGDVPDRLRERRRSSCTRKRWKVASDRSRRTEARSPAAQAACTRRKRAFT
jgi:hypothetical protein